MNEEQLPNPLADGVIRAEIRRARQESESDDANSRHEEGGYILLNHDRSYAVHRWPRGERSGIMPPALDSNNFYNDKEVVATFHTHPNPAIDESGREWNESPSERDRRWHVRRGLRGFVVGKGFIYEIDVNGEIKVLGRREEML